MKVVALVRYVKFIGHICPYVSYEIPTESKAGSKSSE